MMPESLVAPLRQRFRAKRPTRGVGTLAGAVAISRGPGGRWAESSRTPDAAPQAVHRAAARSPSLARCACRVRAGDRVRCAADCRVYLVPGFLAGLTPRSVVLFPERPADGRWGAGSRLVFAPGSAILANLRRGLPAAGYCRVVASDLRHDDAQTLRCQSLLSD